MKSIFLFLAFFSIINTQQISASDNHALTQDLYYSIIIDKAGCFVMNTPAGEMADWSESYLKNDVDTQILFNGVSLDGWEIIDFTGHGNVSIDDSCVIIGMGLGITGIRWTKDFPNTNYEVSLEAKRVKGEDFFCGLTFPVKDSFCTFVIGGWGGSIVGLSSIDDEDAANNITYDFRNFILDRWYKIRVKVTDEKIETWINKDKIVDFTIGNHSISLRWEAESSKPFGVITWQTTGAVRNIRLHPDLIQMNSIR